MMDEDGGGMNHRGGGSSNDLVGSMMDVMMLGGGGGAYFSFPRTFMTILVLLPRLLSSFQFLVRSLTRVGALLKKKPRRPSVSRVMSGTLSTKNGTVTNVDISTTFVAVVENVYKVFCGDMKASKNCNLIEIPTLKRSYCSAPRAYVPLVIPLDEKEGIAVSDDVLVYVSMKEGKSTPTSTMSDNNDVTHSNNPGFVSYVVRLQLSESCRDISVLDAYVRRCMEEAEDKKADELKRPHVLVMRSEPSSAKSTSCFKKDKKQRDSTSDVDDTSSSESGEAAAHERSRSSSPGSWSFEAIPLKSTKSMTNVYFEGKQELVAAIDRFQNGSERHRRLGIPHKMGILLSGEPGNGKTGFTQALASYTGRHLIVVNPDLIRTEDDLNQIFMQSTVGGYKIPNAKRLYAIEDFEDSRFGKALLRRSENDAAIDKKNRAVRGKVGLGHVLRVLDGLVPREDQIIVMMCNCDPAVFDPALMRPGRIDHSVVFKRLRVVDVLEVYRSWFDAYPPPSVVASMTDYVFRIADLGKLFSTEDTTLIDQVLSLSSESVAGAGAAQP